MIREHDSQVQGNIDLMCVFIMNFIIIFRFLEIEMDLFKDINEFMSLQSKTKEISASERAELIKRIKNSFLSTLTHCEEKVSLSNQCYNSVRRMKEKLSGYISRFCVGGKAFN